MDTLWGQGKDVISANKQYATIDEQGDRFLAHRLSDMADRVEAGKPPAAVAELHELAKWYDANSGRLPWRDGRIELSTGRTVCRPLHVDYLIDQTKRTGITELVEDLRALRAMLG
jgi:hypothetical protein